MFIERLTKTFVSQSIELNIVLRSFLRVPASYDGWQVVRFKPTLIKNIRPNCSHYNHSLKY